MVVCNAKNYRDSMKFIRVAAFLTFFLSGSYASAEEAECGILGSIQFKVPTEYLFFPIERTGGIWGEGKAINDHDDCQQAIQAVTLEYYFPSLLPAKGYNVFNDPDRSHVEVAIAKITSIGPRTLNARVSRYSEEMRRLGPVSEVSSGDYQGISGIDPVYGKGSVDFYWKGNGEAVAETLMCRRLSLMSTNLETCTLSFFLDKAPASVTVIFSSRLISRLGEIKASALQVVNKFTK
jgi:hypothetical protein